MAIEYYFELLTADRKKHFWTRIKSRNGKIVWTSEMYTTKANALRPVRKLIQRVGSKWCDLKTIKVKGGK